MNKIILFITVLCITQVLAAQVANDLKESVPLWLDFDMTSNQATLQWLDDPGANNYVVSETEYSPSTLTTIANLAGTETSYNIGTLNAGQLYTYNVRKNSIGEGIITVGLEVPVVHERGRCLIAIDDTLVQPLALEIDQFIEDLEMDGWEVDTLNIERTVDVPTVKSKVVNWYDANYVESQALFLLGHIAVPYSGNSAYDGHSNHSGAWAADVFYGEVDGVWTDATVNNTSPSRQANKNIPNDGKYDQTTIPSTVEVEVGRADFSNLPAFPDDEIELTRQYLNKNHAFRIGDNEYRQRGLVRNNFASFGEGFGQSGWRNFTTMFGGDSVSVQSYGVLENEKYLCSYACGSGTYTSAGGIGSTDNLWVAKDIQTVFTMTFGSYFGDWDTENNFLRSALASGDILTNAWAGRPVWQMFHMALGKHIGYSTLVTQNATYGTFDQGSSANRVHIALMGDPTVRLHPVKRVENLNAIKCGTDVSLDWTASPHADNGYLIYKRVNGSDWELLEEFYASTSYVESITTFDPNDKIEYMVKSIRLELTGSGTYYNTSLGVATCTDNDSNCINVDLKVFLEGAYLNGTGTMRTELAAQNLIPLQQPYNTAPYNYIGTETLTSIPTQMTDWVLVEVRTSTNPSSTIATQAAILMEDGYIKALDGIRNLTFNLAQNEDYYFVIRHRNHLDIMTATTISHAPNITYDFTNNTTTAYGASQLKILIDGKTVMYAGDITQDHVIQVTDADAWKSDPAILSTYHPSDLNLDGVVQVTDYDSWYLNQAKIAPPELAY